MIRSFKDSITEGVYHGKHTPGLPRYILKRARRKLSIIDAARELRDLKSPPGNKLHSLGADRKGQHSIWINDQFRICFVWNEGDAYDVEITDYH